MLSVHNADDRISVIGAKPSCKDQVNTVNVIIKIDQCLPPVQKMSYLVNEKFVYCFSQDDRHSFH